MIKLKGVTEGEIDQSIKQDSENEDDEFKRIQTENEFRKRELERVRNLTR